MSALSVNISVLPDVGGVNQAKTPTQDTVDGFLALLDLVDAGSDDEPTRHEQEDIRKQPSPVAAPIDLPVAIFADAAPVPRLEDVPPRRADVPPAADDATIKDSPSREPAPAKTSERTESSPLPNDKTTPPALPDQADDEIKDKNVLPEDIGTAAHLLRTRLEARLADIGAILSAIIQGMTGGSPATGEQAIAGNTPALIAVPETAGSKLSDIVVPPIAAIALPPGLAINAAEILPANTEALPLLQDIQSILQQLRQALQGIETPGATGTAATAIPLPVHNDLPVAPTTGVLPFSAPQDSPLPNPSGSDTDTLNAILQTLQRDVVRLTQLVDENDSASGDPSFSLTDAPPLDDLKTLLKASIAEVKVELRKLANDNESIFSAFKANVAPPQADATLTADALFDSGKIIKDNVATTLSQAANTAVAPSSPSLPVQPNAPVTAPPPSVAGIVQNSTGDAGSHAGSNSGGQNQPMPQPLTAPAAASSSPAVSGASSFAQTLNRAGQPPLLEQIAFNIKTALKDGSSRIHIQLEPAELGRLDIKLNVSSDGKTGITIVADNKATLTLLQGDAPGLARALSDAGLKADIGNMNFSLNGGQHEGAQEQPTAGAALTYRNAQDENGEDIGSVISRSYVVNLAEGLDITI